MKFHRFALCLFLVLVFPAREAGAVTSDDLACYFGINSWSTTVFLEGGSYVVEIYEIKDGKVDQRILEGQKDWSAKGATGITVMIGKEGGKYRVVAVYQSGSTVSTTSTFDAPFGASMAPALPEKIREGDYLLMGESEGKIKGGNNSISDYTRGFLMRVKLVSE